MKDIFKNLTKSIEEELKNLIYIDYMDERDDVDIASFMAVIKQNIDKYWDLELDLFNYKIWWVSSEVYKPREDSDVVLYINFLDKKFFYKITLGYNYESLGYCQCTEEDEGYDFRYKCTGEHCDWDRPTMRIERVEEIGYNEFEGTQKDLWDYKDKYNKTDKDLELEKKNAEIKDLEDKIKELQNKLDNIKEDK